jgi:hypothetical protein
MMNFETLQTNLVTILGNAAAGRYRVAGFQPKSNDAEEYLDNNRLVSVYFSEGQFPENMNSIAGSSKQHMATYRIELFVTAGAKGDLATIDNPASTPAQIQTAIANIKDAELLADESWNELCGIIYQVLMDGRNLDLDMPSGTIANRYLDNIRKDRPAEIGVARGVLGGQFITITGSMDLTCILDEPVLGDTGTAADTIDTVLDIDNDDNERTGVQIGITPSP